MLFVFMEKYEDCLTGSLSYLEILVVIEIVSEY